jgi:hypothetical protein
MKIKLSKKRAISTVLTTVIILVASVVLGSGVVLFGTSLFQEGTQMQSISVSNTKVWVHPTATDGLSWGATAVRNSGDTTVSIDKIQIRGADIPYSQWYPDISVTSSLFQQTLNHSGWSSTAGLLVQDADGCSAETIQIELSSSTTDDVCANPATGPVSLGSGELAIIYFKLTNGTITPLDSGLNTNVGIYAGQAGSPVSLTVEGITYQP